MAKSFTEIVGMLQELIAYMSDAENVATLAGKGLDIAPLRTRLQNKLTAMTQKNADQEQAKVAVLNLTAALNALSDDAYSDGSSMMDAMIGMIGKSTPAAKNLQRIRTGFGPGPAASGSPSPTPTPTPSPIPSSPPSPTPVPPPPSP